MAHSVFYLATHVHRIVSTVIEINVCHIGGPAQILHKSLEFHNLLLSNLITAQRLVLFLTCTTLLFNLSSYSNVVALDFCS